MKHRAKEVKQPRFKTGWRLFVLGLAVILWYLAAPLPASIAYAVTTPISAGAGERRINPNLRILAEWHKEGLPDPENPHLGGKSGGLLEGSSRSGKTISSVDFIIRLCTKAKRPLTINVFKKTYNSFKTTLYIDFSKRLQDFGLDDPFAGKKEVSSFFILGSKITFIGADSSDETILGASCDYAYFNEMLDIPQHIFDQVEMRCERFWWGDYNPKTTVHWVYDKIQRRKDVGFLRTTFKDNPWIPQAQKRKILSYCPYHPDDEHLPEKQRRPHPVNVEAGTADDYMWNVYGLGLRSAPEGLIFQHVTWIEHFPENIENIYYGSDIGYTQSPSTLVKMGVNGDNMYLELLHYGPTPSSNEYIPIIREFNPGGITWADSAEPGYIIDCGQVGLTVIGVKKFPGSIKYGISLMKKYKIHLVDCPEWRDEQANYKYREINGVRFDDPVDDFNHCFAAGTLITTQHGEIPIEFLGPGYNVLTSEGYQPVMERFHNGKKHVKTYLLVHSAGFIKVRCTPTHKVKTPEGWVEVQDIQPGTTIYHSEYPRTITYIKAGNPGVEDVYDIAVENTHEYFANGLLVSNCWDAARYAALSNLMF